MFAAFLGQNHWQSHNGILKLPGFKFYHSIHEQAKALRDVEPCLGGGFKQGAAPLLAGLKNLI